jgi:predicted RNA-binding protein YlxR (DUF448 family)
MAQSAADGYPTSPSKISQIAHLKCLADAGADRGPDHDLVVVVQLKTGEIVAEKLSSSKGTGVYVTGQATG